MRPIGTHNYYIYILTNRQKSVLYVGVTNSLEGRLLEHRNGHGSAFTKRYNCHFLVYYERYQYVGKAIAREKEIKGWSRKKKEDLNAEMNPEWCFLDPAVD